MMKVMWSLRMAVLVVAVLCPSPSAQAQPKGPQPWWPVQPRPLPFVHTLFTDDMVLQRDIKAPVWGWTTPGDTVTIAIDGKPAGVAAIADRDGKWMTKVNPMPAGGPHTITIAG